MDQGIYTAASGAIAMEERLNVISHNIANVNTVGYKKDHILYREFTKILDTSMLAQGQYRVIPVDVVATRPTVDLTQGVSMKTDNPLDVAINGEGFFVVMTEDGSRYTRAGSFMISEDNNLVTPQGHRVQGKGGDITIDTTTGDGQVVIGPDGRISYDGTEVDSLQVVNIPAEALVRAGGNLFAVRDGHVPDPVENPSVSQGYLERANVEPVTEMVELITTQRAYEAYQRMIRSINDAYSNSIRNVGAVS
ncbi:MAG TPA: flagellar basal-body rod protein FlgF [Deltaproteobacteria bacterium]|nr:flagellar basal-body rod protein FlgF [Deltaproteobacteria bacterium]